MKVFKHFQPEIPRQYLNKFRIYNIPNNDWDDYIRRNQIKTNMGGYDCLMLREDESFNNCHKGKIGYIIGKGPSLDLATKDSFIPDCPIYAVNEAYIVIRELRLSNPIYFLQADIPRVIYVGNNDIKFTTYKGGRHYHDQENLYIMEDDRWPVFLTSVYAIKLANYMGCDNITLVGFDAFDCVEGYSNSVTPEHIRINKRIVHNHIGHVKKIKLLLAKLYPNYLRLKNDNTIETHST